MTPKNIVISILGGIISNAIWYCIIKLIGLD